MKKILVIDDSWLTRRGIIGILGSDKYEMIEALNGQDGIEKIEKEKPDCILLDLLMPEMGGIEVLKALREKADSAPVIILSADIQETSREQCFKLGAFEFINKPPNENELRGIVKRAVGDERAI